MNPYLQALIFVLILTVPIALHAWWLSRPARGCAGRTAPRPASSPRAGRVERPGYCPSCNSSLIYVDGCLVCGWSRG